jgi:cobalt-zinc-cadmium efflux system protein
VSFFQHLYPVSEEKLSVKYDSFPVRKREAKGQITMHLHSHTEKKLWAAIILNGLIPVMEIAGGILVGSLALISDALHNLIDLFSLLLSLVGERALRWKANEVKTYGYGRVEILISVINALVLIAVSIFILYRAAQALFTPHSLPGVLIMGIAGGAFCANLASALLLKKDARESLNIRSAFLHLILDAGQSLAIVVAGALIALWGWSFLDPIFSMVIGIFIFYTAGKVLKEGLNILDEGVPQDLKLLEIEGFIRAFPGIQGVHHLHIWSISSRNRALSAHLVLEDQLLSQSGRVINELSQALRERFLVTHPTFQVECGICPNGSCFSEE